MVVEQIVFVIIAFALFVYMFCKMMKRNDISYIIVLVIETIGIALNFLSVLLGIKSNILIMIIKYIFGIILPIAIICYEYRGKTIAETFNIFIVKRLIKLENIKKAKKILLELASKYPENYDAHRLLAETYEQEGGMRKAIDEYVQAVDINKQDYDSYYRVAYLLTCLEREDEASQMLFSLLEKKPDFIQASILLGDLLIKKESYKEAAGIYQNALKYNPVNYEINYNLGIVYTMLNDFQNAKICYEKAAQINAISYSSKYALAQIELIYKNLDEAERKFLEVVESEELSADAYYELAKIHLIKGDKETAIKYANVAIDIKPKTMAKKVKLEPIFIPILAKLSIPFNLDHKDENERVIKKDEKKLEEKDIKAKEHLEEMIDLTRKLSYNDMNLRKADEHGSGVNSNKKFLRRDENREKN